MNTINITPILEAIISVSTIIIMRYVIPWLSAKVGQSRLEKLWEYAEMAVTAAEQIYGSGKGDEKAEYVRRYLADHGFSVSNGDVQSALEAAVYNLNSAIRSGKGNEKETAQAD